MSHDRSQFFLAVIVSFYLVSGFAYASITPKWNAPDEPAHFNYIRHIAEKGQLPVLRQGDYDQQYLSKLVSLKFPDYLPIDSLTYESHQPPLYYFWGALVYRATSSLSLNQQVLLLRLLNVLIGALVLLIAYAVAQEIFPRDRLMALAVPGFVAVVPMHIANAASITNDVLAEAVFSGVILLLIRGLQLGFSTERLQWIGLLLGVALLTKTTIYPALLLLPVALGLYGMARLTPLTERQKIVAEARMGPSDRGGGSRSVETGGAVRVSMRILGALGIVYGLALLPSGWWFVRNALQYGPTDIFGWRRHAEVVVGQPTTILDWAAAQHFVTTSFKSFWAQFGWMGITVDERIYWFLLALSIYAALGLVFFCLELVGRRRSISDRQKASLALLLVAFILVFGGFIFYNLTFIQPQSRYLYPAILAIATFFVIGLKEVMPERHAHKLFFGLYVLFLGLDLGSLYWFIIPYFATS